ncbi:hypothetical protein FOA52_013230 [Chlamydomonas sp. UWO 241]|nr:hypothetical protein FOA52_013230 [Chlamydomonas sp. UWO 241]
MESTGDAKLVEGEFTSTRGIKLYTLSALPPRGTVTRCVLVFAHGLSDHVGRHLPVLGDALTKSGVAVLGYDMRGHGRSGPHHPQMRNYVRTFGELVSDLQAFLAGPVRDRFPGLPVFLMGHSMGAAVCMLTACRSPSGISGLVLSSPLVAIQSHPRPWSSWAIAATVRAANWLPGAGHVRVVPRRPIELGMRDEAAIQAMHDDGLWDRQSYMLGTIASLLDGVACLQREVPAGLPPSLPLYVQQGTEDVATPHRHLRALLARLAAARAARASAASAASVIGTGGGSSGSQQSGGIGETNPQPQPVSTSGLGGWWAPRAPPRDPGAAAAARGPELCGEELAAVGIVYHEVEGGFHDLNHDHETSVCLERIAAWLDVQLEG